ECQVFLVGYNPATNMSDNFWDFWTEQGFDRTLWYAEYLRERATRPLKPGKTRRQNVSSTRRMMDKVIEGAGIPILETNLYAHPSVDAKSLKHKDRRPFDFLLDTIQPKVIVTHGEDAKQVMAEIQTSAKVISVPHLSRGWSFDRALSLGQNIKNLVV
ncbi:MAG: type B chloramphenicol O-acetyltransferase, partial [Rhodospirillaceae bacterium]|nr:type B chloramphenicol O-acetyltransferase [Rhodospirillaceae bacterium]